MHRLRVVCAFLILGGLTAVTRAEPPASPRELSAARDIRVLVPAGIAARWPLYNITLDEDGQPSYNIRRRIRHHGALETVATMATRAKPDVPRTRPVGTYETGTEPVILDREVYIPALQRTVRYYLQSHGDGADNDYYCTEPVAWPDGHGGTLWLVIQAEVDGTPPPKLLASVEWKEPGVVARWKPASH